jgi:hypothetical protein
MPNTLIIGRGHIFKGKYLKLLPSEIHYFESAIDRVRRGDITDLFNFYSIFMPDEIGEYLEKNQLPYLDTHNWRQKLKPYSKLVKELKKKYGL